MRIFNQVQWGRWDSNPHALRHQILNLARLPIPALPQGIQHDPKSCCFPRERQSLNHSIYQKTLLKIPKTDTNIPPPLIGQLEHSSGCTPISMRYCIVPSTNCLDSTTTTCKKLRGY